MRDDKLPINTASRSPQRGGSVIYMSLALNGAARIPARVERVLVKTETVEYVRMLWDEYGIGNGDH